MGEAWRIVKEKHVATAFTGEGAAKTGGRWNSRGVFLVYTSGTKSLATLESLVHLNPPVLFNYVAFPLQFDDVFVEFFPLKNLPADWRTEHITTKIKLASFIFEVFWRPFFSKIFSNFWPSAMFI